MCEHGATLHSQGQEAMLTTKTFETRMASGVELAALAHSASRSATAIMEVAARADGNPRGGPSMTSVPSSSRSQAKKVLVAAAAALLVIGSAVATVRADAITDDNVEAALAAAKTPADHEALAAYFTAKSNEARDNVAKHKRMSSLFGGKGKTSWEGHCRSLMRTYEEQAKDYAALAKEQKAVAAALSK